MKRDKEIVTLSVLLLVNLARSDVPYDLFKREEPCNTLCEKIPLFFANNEHVLSCCQRGCRFYNLVDLRGGENLNGTRDACEAACTEAYTELQDRYACSTGCDVMVIQRMSDLLSLFSAPIDIEEIMDSNVLLMSPDMPESDILTDPGLRKELLPRWWDFNGFKLPQTYIKTVPIDAETVEYDIPSDYSGENDQPGSIPGYVLRHIGISDWLLASTAAVALCAIWFCLCSECEILF
ncbi:hypothetical protein KM043_012414 [Ampulex compressa]|nr:hypothetical protein KM043_012414 [Ampulex compressa]